jgi:hypothetical protein
VHRALTPQRTDVVVVDAPEPTPPHVKRLEYGVIEVDATFDGHDAVLPTGITIPSGWESRIEVHVDFARSTVATYEVADIGTFTTQYPFQVITPTACSTESGKPIRLQVHADTAGAHHVTFVIRPSLVAAPC